VEVGTRLMVGLALMRGVSLLAARKCTRFPMTVEITDVSVLIIRTKIAGRPWPILRMMDSRDFGQ